MGVEQVECMSRESRVWLPNWVISTMCLVRRGYITIYREILYGVHRIWTNYMTWS